MLYISVSVNFDLSDKLIEFRDNLVRYKVEQGFWVEINPLEVVLVTRMLYVPKKDCFRGVTDARIPNSFIVKKQLFVESLRTQLNYLKGSTLYCSIDGKEMYHQLLHDDKHRIFCVFLNGKFYLQTRLGMGFKNLEVYLQQAISYIYHEEGIGYDIMLRCADNFLIHGTDDHDCAQKFIHVMEAFAKYGLVISPQCDLLCNE